MYGLCCNILGGGPPTAMVHLFDQKRKAPVLKLNLEKCEGLWLGAWKSRSDSPVPIAWTSELPKVLFNWQPRISAVEKCLSSWRCQSLSFQGKALVINALALSRISYVASLVFMPSWVLSKLESIVFNFFWSGKRDLVARKVVVHSLQSRGLRSMLCLISGLDIFYLLLVLGSPCLLFGSLTALELPLMMFCRTC